MRAIRAYEFGGADVLRLDDIASPTVGESDILVRVVASGVNPIEWKIRSGAMARALGRPLPATFGWECAGIVISVGSSVRTFKAGDAVFSYPEFTRGGTHADQVAIAANQVALKTGTLDFAAAAAAPMTAQAAWTALDAAAIKSGERILIHGAGGAVGHWLVQLAKLRGAEVIATASGGQLNAVAELGAQQMIDYREQRFEDIGAVTVVFDLVGGETQERSWALLGVGGRLISTVSPPAPQRNDAAASATRRAGSRRRGARRRAPPSGRRNEARCAPAQHAWRGRCGRRQSLRDERDRQSRDESRLSGP